MKVLTADNIDKVFRTGVAIMRDQGIPTDSRNGKVLVYPSPVTTVYNYPWKRVLLHPVRDANPFFHFFESLWMLAGRRDVKFVNMFAKQISEYSDDGAVFNAAYGYRMRNHFHKNNIINDQLSNIIEILSKDPNSRQAVIQLWDPSDLTKQTKDKACNMSMVFSVRLGKLELTVYNRSNDMIWGAYGANVVHMSMFQEYVAAKLGLPMGKYYQVSNNFHVYTEGRPGEIWKKLTDGETFVRIIPYPDDDKCVSMLGENMDSFDEDLKLFFRAFDRHQCLELIPDYLYYSAALNTNYFKDLVFPMLDTFIYYKNEGKLKALEESKKIKSEDWRIAVEIWLTNRKTEHVK